MPNSTDFKTSLLFWLMLGVMSLAHAGESGLALGPALILVRDVPLGRSFSLQEAAQIRYRLTNNSDQSGDFEVVCSLPMDAGMRQHEVGYEAPPNTAWFTLDKHVVTLAAHAQAEFGLRINIPELPEYFNRHWMLYIDAGPVPHVGIGAALRLRARVMLETQVKEGLEAVLSQCGEPAVTPGMVAMQTVGASWEGQARVRNNSTQSATYDVLRLDQVIPHDQADKRARYFDRAPMATRVAWGRPVETSVVLAPGAEQVVHIAATPAAAEVTSEVIDEVIFIARRAAADVDPEACRIFAGQRYDRASMVRLRYQPSIPGVGNKP